MPVVATKILKVDPTAAPDVDGSATTNDASSPTPTQTTVAPSSSSGTVMGAVKANAPANDAPTVAATTSDAVSTPSSTSTATSVPAPATTTSGTATAAANDPNASVTDGGPVLRDVNSSTDTVGGQLSTLMQADNPIIAQARANAAKAANERGLQNSSMAAGAGEEAAVSSMLPVAQQDASTYAQQGQHNQDTSNQFTLQGRQFKQDTAQQQRQIEATHADVNSQVSAQMADSAARVALGSAQIAASKEMADAQIQANERLAELQSSTSLTEQGRQIATTLQLDDRDNAVRTAINTQGLQQNTVTNFTQQITAILTDANMDSGSKETAIRNLNAIYAGNPYLPTGININGLPPVTPPVQPAAPINTDTGGGGGGG